MEIVVVHPVDMNHPLSNVELQLDLVILLNSAQVVVELAQLIVFLAAEVSFTFYLIFLIDSSCLPCY